jgi:heat shock protein HslJ
MKRRAMVMVLPVLILSAGCRTGEDAAPPSGGGAETAEGPPTLGELQNATYQGFEETAGPVDLVDGRWTGEPYQEGGASRPQVIFFRDFHVLGDLDGDGVDEAIVLLVATSGGSASRGYMAVVARRGENLENIATTPLGDRIQVRDARVETGRVFLDVVRAGPGDPACCPGELATLGFRLTAGGLEPFDTGVAPSRLSLEALGDEDWALRWWSWDEAAPEDPILTLRLEAGRFTGFSGCNRYLAPVRETGTQPGAIEVGPGPATKMACPGPAGEAEERFLRQLEGVTRFGFMTGQLMLSYTTDGRSGVMLFDPYVHEEESGI